MCTCGVQHCTTVLEHDVWWASSTSNTLPPAIQNITRRTRIKSKIHMVWTYLVCLPGNYNNNNKQEKTKGKNRKAWWTTFYWRGDRAQSQAGFGTTVTAVPAAAAVPPAVYETNVVPHKQETHIYENPYILWYYIVVKYVRCTFICLFGRLLTSE